MNDVEKYLLKYKNLKYELEYYNNKLYNLKASSCSNNGGGYSDHDNKILYLTKIDEIKKEMSDVESFVDCQWEGLERYIIYSRYIECLTLREISERVGYSTTSVFNKIYSCLSKF